MKLRIESLRAAWRERTVQAILSIALWWAIFARVIDGYGPGSAVIAATCIAWGYILVSSYATHLLNSRAAGADRPQGPAGRHPGARP